MLESTCLDGHTATASRVPALHVASTAIDEWPLPLISIGIKVQAGDSLPQEPATKALLAARQKVPKVMRHQPSVLGLAIAATRLQRR